MFAKLSLLVTGFISITTLAFSSGYGVFTQGASGLGQANAVVAHPTGPSSLYFNPALLNDVPGRQLEIGSTGLYADRKVKLDDGSSESSKDNWNFPSTFYYTHQINDNLTAGLGVFFPFGLSTNWGDDFAGKYIGTSSEMLTMNINPAFSYRVNDRLSLAAGLSILYLDASLESKTNQTAVGIIAAPPFGLGELPDINQKFEGDGWGTGYNLGLLFKASDRISIGAAYRSHIDIDVEGDVHFDSVIPSFSPQFPNTGGHTDIRLPAQATAGVAVQVLEPLVIEAGVRWEDWESSEELNIVFDAPVLGQPNNIVERNWKSTWSYNLGGQYALNETVAINAGYLYAENAVPESTFEPSIPDTDVHLFCLGTELTFDRWVVSGSFGYEYHDKRNKNNLVGDQLGSMVASAIAGQPVAVGTANGEYDTDIYLFALSLGYRF